MSNNKNKQFFQGKECFSRMNFLYQASMLMAGTNDTLSAYYGRLCRNIGKKAVLRIDPEVKRNLCKRCSLSQQPGLTADLSVTPKITRRKRRKRAQQLQNIDEHAHMQLTCRKCGYQRDFLVNSDYKFWLETPEAVVETINLKTDQTKATVSDGGKRKNNAENPKSDINTETAAHFKILQRLLSASVIDGNVLEVQQKNGQLMKFPVVWLRHNCQCGACFHDKTKSRKINWERTNVNSSIQAISTAHGNSVTIGWQDTHKSTFELSWLQEREFAPESRIRYIEEIYKPHRHTGSGPKLNSSRSFKRETLTMSSAKMVTLAAQGFGITKHAPHDITVARQLANLIGFMKRTTYGEFKEEEFKVKSKENARSYAYLMTPLPLHTDMPYYEYKAGITILNFSVQSHSKGGSNLLTTNFYIAETMRKQYLKCFETLVKTPVDWYDIYHDSGMSFHTIWRAAVNCLDVDERYHRTHENSTKRDSHFTVPLEQVEPWHKAYGKFLELAYAEAVEFKTTPGDMFVFNNLRMLHGRTAYEDSPENKRHMIGAYVDWDIFSKMRTLKTQQK